jgi:hypothetical protein
MNIRGFLRWQFEGTLTSPCFYGFALTLLACVAVIGGCPAPWPMTMAVTGLAVIVIDTARAWFRFSYSLYQLEQQNIQRELQRKQQ